MKSSLQRFRDLPWYQEVGILAGVAFFLSLPVWLTYGLAGREKQVSTVENFYWKRIIKIETFRVVHESKTSWSPPNDAYNVKEWTEWWTESHNTYDDKGNIDGSYTTLESETYYSYDVNRWKYLREVKADAWDHTPHWPKYELAMGPLGKENRLGKKPTYYEIHITGDEGSKVFKTTQKVWDRYKMGETVVAVVNGFGWVLQLEQLEASN